MKKTIAMIGLICLLFMQPASCEESTKPQPFSDLTMETMIIRNGVRFNMSLKEVKRTESQKPVQETKTTLGYTGLDVAGIENVDLIYIFKKGKLNSVAYEFPGGVVNPAKYIPDFEAVNALLIEKFGEPNTNDPIWVDDKLKGNPANYGAALLIGDLSYMTVWKNDTIGILHSLRYEDNEVRHRLFYVTASSYNEALDIPASGL